MSKHGIYPLSRTLDHPGPMTRTVEDNALLLGVLSGHDGRDPYSVESGTEDFTRKLGRSLEGMTVGVPSSFYYDHVEPEVASVVHEAIHTLNKLGAELREVEMPRMNEILSAQRTVLAAEAFAIHYENLKNGPELYEQEVRQRLLSGETIETHEYIASREMRHVAVREFESALERVDILATPTLPALPTEIDQRFVSIRGHREPVRSALTRLTGPANLNGFPSLSVPAGLSETGLPIGLQLLGRAFDEATLYQFGGALEAAVGGEAG